MASSFAFEAIGTHWQIDIYQALSSDEESAVLLAIRERIELFESIYSRFRETSLVTEMSQKAGTYTLPDDAKDMLSLYHDLYNITEGFFTPFIGQALVDAGYDANYSLEQKRELSTPPIWDEVIEYNHPTLVVKKPVLFDFGAAGKGYIIDIMGKLMREHRITAFCVDAGGDMLQHNTTPLRVALEHPDDPTKAIGVVEIMNGSLCGSAGNRRKWAKFHHIINPKKLTSADEILAVWVMADSAMLADAIATCLFFVPHSMLAMYKFEYLLIKSDYTIEKSAGFIVKEI